MSRKLWLALVLLFLLSEIVFAYFVVVSGDEDLIGSVDKTLVFLLLIFLTYKGRPFVGWLTSILLILYGLLCLLVGWELNPVFYLLGLFDISFGALVMRDLIKRKRFPVRSLKVTQRVEGGFVIDDRVYYYPRLIKRYKALLIDAVLLLTALIIIMLVVQENPYRTTLMLSLGYGILLTYEPILTAYSATLGQRIMKIRVRRLQDPSTEISLLNAYMRWLTKALLGWLSFITINLNPEHRAIHDYSSGSVMIEVDRVDSKNVAS